MAFCTAWRESSKFFRVGLELQEGEQAGILCGSISGIFLRAARLLLHALGLGGAGGSARLRGHVNPCEDCTRRSLASVFIRHSPRLA
jgi:hypothetical protein